MVWMPYIAVLLWLLSFLVEIWLEPTTLWFNTEHPPNCTMDSSPLRHYQRGPSFHQSKAGHGNSGFFMFKFYWWLWVSYLKLGMKDKYCNCDGPITESEIEYGVFEENGACFASVFGDDLGFPQDKNKRRTFGWVDCPFPNLFWAAQSM